MKIVMCLAAILFNFGSAVQQCASNQYQLCAAEGGICTIDDSVKSGYMSYGVDGRYNLIPFSNGGGTDLSIQCDKENGDISSGKVKYCCFISTDTGLDPAKFSGNFAEGVTVTSQTVSYTGARYGTGSRFIYRINNGAHIPCNVDFFNDPALNIHKTCGFALNINLPGLPPPTSTKWQLCGNEQIGACSNLDKGAAQWIRYGNNGFYHFRLVISSSDGVVPCNLDFFGADPIPGVVKHCWRAPAQYTFTNLVGQWNKLQSCVGCDSNTFERSVGVTESTGSEITKEWQQSLTASLSVGFSFLGASVSGTVSQSVTNRMSSSLSTTVTQTTGFTCKKDSLYQWNIGSTQMNGISTKTFQVKGQDLACLHTPLQPKCPPGYCKDDNCQTCTEPLSI